MVIGLGVWLLAQGGTAADATGVGLLVLGVFAGIVLATVFSVVGGYAPGADLPLRDRTGDAECGAAVVCRRVRQQVNLRPAHECGQELAATVHSLQTSPLPARNRGNEIQERTAWTSRSS